MSKLFSEETPVEFKQTISDKVEEARENGKAELIEGEENLQFAAVEDGIVVEDQANDNEVTLIKENPDDPMDLQCEAVNMSDDETPAQKEQYEEGFKAGEQYEEGKEAEKADESDKAPTSEVSPETKEESETQPSVEVAPMNGKDGDRVEDTVPEVKVEVTTGINDAEKAGLRSFSFHFIGASEGYIAKTLKTFSDIMGDVKDTVESLEKSEEKAEAIAQPSDEEKSFNADEMKEVNEVIEQANKLAEKAEKMDGDLEVAKEVKEMSEQCLCKLHELKDKGHDVAQAEEQVITFSEKAAEILDKDEVEKPEDKPEAEKPEDKPEVKTESDDESKAEDEKAAEGDKKESDEITEDQQKQFSACLTTKFDDMSVRPVIAVSEQKTFSQKPEAKPVSINPFLTTKFE